MQEGTQKKSIFTIKADYPWFLRELITYAGLSNFCVICDNLQRQAGIAPTKGKKHFTMNHSHLTNKGVDSFKQLLESQNNKVLKAHSVKSLQEASYFRV